jgi:hypothetical protein
MSQIQNMIVQITKGLLFFVIPILVIKVLARVWRVNFEFRYSYFVLPREGHINSTDHS